MKDKRSRKVLRSYRFSKHTINELQKIAIAQESSMSGIVEIAIHQFIDRTKWEVQS